MLKAALRMPLHGQHFVSRLSSLNGFNNFVFLTARHHAQAITDDLSRLMMAGIHRQWRARFALCRTAQYRARLNPHLMRDFHLRASRMIGRGLNMLHQRATAPYIKGLQSVANTKNGFPQIIGVLKQKLVSRIAQLVRSRGLRMSGCVEFLGIDIGLAAGKQTAEHPVALRAISSGELANDITTGSPPAASTARRYAGNARLLYSGSYEHGSGMAIRGFTGFSLMPRQRPVNHANSSLGENLYQFNFSVLQFGRDAHRICRQGIASICGYIEYSGFHLHHSTRFLQLLSHSYSYGSWLPGFAPRRSRTEALE